MPEPWPSWRSDRWLEGLDLLSRLVGRAINVGLASDEETQVIETLELLAESLPPPMLDESELNR